MTENIKSGAGLLKIIAVLLTSVFSINMYAREVAERQITDGTGQDSTKCADNASAYKTFYYNNEINTALDYWRQVLDSCPAFSEDLYEDGESMYLGQYDRTGDLAFIDTVLMTLNQRSYYFDSKVSNDLHASSLLFDLAGDDPVYLGLSYNMLRETADIYPDQMECRHLIMMATAAASLYAMEIIDPEELEAAFVIAIVSLQTRLENNPADAEYSEDLENLETYFSSCGAMTCSSIEKLYTKKIDRYFRDTVLLNKVDAMLTETGCTGSDLYYSIALKRFANDRSAANAVRLAELNIDRNDIERAISYFTEAYNRDTTSAVRSEVILRVAEMELARGKRQEARNRGEHAWQLNKRNGRALLFLAECYAGAEMGNAFDNHAVYWVAVDYLRAARDVDPSLAETADARIKEYEKLYPTREECFYKRILDEGLIYNVGGWVGEVTRVKFRKE
jgi:tetratricopeptide (TPR) repeat protein